MTPASIKTWLAALLALLVAVNLLAWWQARRMMYYAPTGEKTSSPEKLGLFRKLAVLVTGVNLPRPATHTVPSVPYETHALKATDGVRLESWLLPQENAQGIVLLFHGYGASKCDLLSEAMAFRALGYSAFLVDFRGSGGSEGDMASLGFHEAKDVAAAFAFVRERWPEQPVILYGQSMGSAAILRAVSKMDLQPDALIIESVFDSLLNTTKNRFDSMGWPSFPFAQLLVFWGGVQSGAWLETHDPVDYAPSIQVPCLFLHGQLDPRAKASQARQVFDRMGSGEKVFALFPDVAHESCYRRDPLRWQEAVRRLLDEAGRRYR